LSSANNESVLVTGASGFTGRHMADRLEQSGYSVIRAVSQSSSEANAYGCDLTDLDAVAQMLSEFKPEYIVHLAAQSFVAHGSARDFYEVNVFGTLNLFEGLAQTGLKPKKVLVASSANVYGNPSCSVIDEQICPAPVNHYAASKLAMEHMVRGWFEKVPTVIVRPFNYTGVGQHVRFLIPKIVEHFKKGQRTISLGNINVSRDFSDVRDVVSAYGNLLTSHCTSETFNLCSGKSYSIADVLSFMNELAGYEIDVKVNPDLVRSNEILKLEGSNAKLRESIGYAPQYDLYQTLTAMYQS